MAMIHTTLHMLSEHSAIFMMHHFKFVFLPRYIKSSYLRKRRDFTILKPVRNTILLDSKLLMLLLPVLESFYHSFAV